MFEEACEILGKQVRPVFVVTRQGEQPARYAVGAAVMVNGAGWTLTAGHVVRAVHQALAAQKEFDALSRREQRNRIKQNPNTVTRAGVRWGSWDEPTVTGEAVVHPNADLALLRLSGFVTPQGYKAPVFRTDAKPGESVCRVGYALLEDIVATSDGDLLHLEQRPPLFVNDGIVARYVTESGISHIEVTSPGLLGQSGGPIADRRGRICGIQARTRHYRLGFGGDNAAYHIGQAVNADVVCEFLRSHNVEHETAETGERR